MAGGDRRGFKGGKGSLKYQEVSYKGKNYLLGFDDLAKPEIVVELYTKFNNKVPLVFSKTTEQIKKEFPSMKFKKN